ncbi:phosphoribosylformylglycinamidine synthase subunit PurS [Patescibacteria group bacterium]|nr:phosphoribosylformylglycinamidine synthase subunit PurS [Patescibacteria group bacterium]
MLQVKICISLKEGVADPQGITIKNALNSLGYQGVGKVRMGKYLQLKLNVKDEKEARREIEDMCKKLLVNPVIENYTYEIQDIGKGSKGSREAQSLRSFW